MSRFTDAELAAEWWRQEDWRATARIRYENYREDHLWDDWLRQMDRLHVVQRFATTLHFNEVAA